MLGFKKSLFNDLKWSIISALQIKKNFQDRLNNNKVIAIYLNIDFMLDLVYSTLSPSKKWMWNWKFRPIRMKWAFLHTLKFNILVTFLLKEIINYLFLFFDQ
jgi:hypothetical protein